MAFEEEMTKKKHFEIKISYMKGGGGGVDNIQSKGYSYLGGVRNFPKFQHLWRQFNIKKCNTLNNLH